MDSIAFGLSALLTAVLVWMLEPIAQRHGLVDRPGGRKDHAYPTPIIGGLAIALAAIGTLFLVGGVSPATCAYGAAAALLLLVGFLDDAYDVRWYWRILSHVVAGLIMIYWGGVRIDYVGTIFTTTPIVLGAWSVPFTLFAIVGLINAINMMDGADGLGGSLCLVALLMLGAAAVYAGNLDLLSWIVPLVSAISVFLLFNMRFPWQRRARVFLGNAGSAFLGLTIGWVVFRLTQNASHPVSPVLAPWLLVVPLIDCLVSIARRIRMGRSPFHADRGHIHHLMLDAGFKPTQVAIALATFSVLMGACAALVLRTNAGTETHLVVGFMLLTAGYYWLTSRRARALLLLGRLHRALLPTRPARAPEWVAEAVAGLDADTTLKAHAANDGVVHVLTLDYIKSRSATKIKHAPQRPVFTENNPPARQSGP
jgi:UDP-GlcNAc:undecaprenyl-phosphate GlcNAc-1-phosphate transferase